VTGSRGPTIILIGGQATLDSGAVVDSRQPLAGDEWDVVLRQALGTSEAWWILAKDLVDIILTQHSEPDAWALAWLDKTFKRPRSDGTFTRVRPKSFLDRAANLLDISKDAGSASFRSDDADTRYRVLSYLLRFDDMKGGPSPNVVVGGFHTTYDDGTDIVGDRPLDYFVARWPEAIIVLPHTPIVEAKARRLLEHPPTDPIRIDSLAERTHPTEARRYAERAEQIDDLRRADSYVINQDFHITFWADQGAVRDPVDLDAALTFVRSRYDLSLGLWDLARDPVLRATLLQREELPPATSAPASVPAELAAKATEKAAERREEKAVELDARRKHHEAIWPTLSHLGWQMPHQQRKGVAYEFAVGPSVPSLYPDREEEPALRLSLAIQKRQTVVALLEIARTGSTDEFLLDQSEVIERITGAPPDAESQAVWRITGSGWAGSTDEWPAHLKTLETLVGELAPRLEPLGNAAAAARIDQLKSSIAEISVTVSPAGASAVETRSLWDRLRGKGRS
jgi:hypothetical protein